MPVHYHIKERIGYITLEGRGPYNVFSPDMVYKPLKKILLEFRDDPEVWVAVITGSPDKKAFSYGGDIQSLAVIRDKDGDETLHRGYTKSFRERAFRPQFGTEEFVDIFHIGKLGLFKPVIFAINGLCLGAAMLMMMSLADIRVAVEEAKFGLVEIKRAIPGDRGFAQVLTEQLPWPIAMDMILRGRMMDAQEAHRLGFINEVVTPENLMPAAISIAEELAANSPLHVQSLKQLTIVGRDISPSAQWLPGLLMSGILQTVPDSQEGPKAFMEKREAKFTGKLD